MIVVVSLSERGSLIRCTQVFRPRRLSGFYRYVRIDFLTHYGTEHYCPVSILRVYGLTQLDAWRRDQEHERSQREQLNKVADIFEREEIWLQMKEGAEQDEEVVVEVVELSEPTDAGSISQASLAPVPSATPPPVESEPAIVFVSPDVSIPTVAADLDSTQTLHDVPAAPEVSYSTSTPTATHSSVEVEATSASSSFSASSSSLVESTVSPVSTLDMYTALTSSEEILSTPYINATFMDERNTANLTAPGDMSSVSLPSSSTSLSTSQTSHGLSETREPTRSGHTAPPLPPPAAQTTQGESIYGTIMKRLSALEQNATLSLRYVEEQDMLLREAFLRMEHRLNDVDVQVTTSFAKFFGARLTCR
jgi:Sad1 / UNC-like C-terminal